MNTDELYNKIISQLDIDKLLSQCRQLGFNYDEEDFKDIVHNLLEYVIKAIRKGEVSSSFSDHHFVVYFHKREDGLFVSFKTFIASANMFCVDNQIDALIDDMPIGPEAAVLSQKNVAQPLRIRLK